MDVVRSFRSWGLWVFKMADITLFPQEIIFEKQLGTMFIYPEQLGRPVTGFNGKDRQGVGGTFYITQYRLIFDAHTINRCTGTTSILLDTISSISDSSSLLHRQFTVVAGITYDLFLFQIHQLKLTLERQVDVKSLSSSLAARLSLQSQLLPPDPGQRPVRAIVRTLLDQKVVTPKSALYMMALYNLWLSLGNP